MSHDEQDYDITQRPIRMTYMTIGADGSSETVVDGKIVYESGPDPVLALLFEGGNITEFAKAWDQDTWRSRVDVTAEDVKHAGVTMDQCEAWLGERFDRRKGHKDGPVSWYKIGDWVCWSGGDWEVWAIVTAVVKRGGTGICAQEILKQMAEIVR